MHAMPRVEDSPLPSGPHWVVSGASSLSEPCQQALLMLDQPPSATTPALPHWRQLLGALVEHRRLDGDEYALSMPHERVLAQAWGWRSDDGCIPWAAWWAAHDGVSLPTGQAWALLSPGHWLMGRDHLTVVEPSSLQLSAADSQALLATVRPFFEEDGWTLQWGAPLRWYASHPSLADYPCASLDRVTGRNPDLWLTDHPQARGVRRLQSEVQMLLYQHPVNDAREAQGLLSINSFWLSGAGVMPEPPPASPPTLVDTLTPALLRDDMHAWLEAWAELDRTVLADIWARHCAGEAVQLTLCGERHAVTLAAGGTAPTGWWSRWAQRLSGRTQRAPAPGAWLAQL